ncbi:MAG: Nre family DNA repair protein [Thermoproteus sp.]
MRIDPSLCIRCRGTKMLCGLPYCPVLVKARVRQYVEAVAGRSSVAGSSPPSVFVGRVGWPRVRVYPSVPPVEGDTSRLEDPRAWLEMSLEEFLASRLILARGALEADVDSARSPSRLLQDVQLLSLSPRPAEVELELKRPLRPEPVLDEHAPPFGPASPLRSLRLGSLPPPERAVERAYNDLDYPAGEAIWDLYRSGIDVHRISRMLSVGALGVGRRRRLVPTRWSITAVDKQLSDRLLAEVRRMPVLDRYLVYVRRTRGNAFVGLLAPRGFMYEWGEAWWPGTTWNYFGGSPEVEVDWEGPQGRTTYPSIGGCYYAARLAAAEALRAMGRQAAVVLWREIYPGFDLPVGVWFVRENVRALFKERPEKFDDLGEALAYMASHLRLPLDVWYSKSRVVKILKTAL